MKIILKEDHQKLGKSGEVVDVRDGYARNFLIPRGLAFPATAANIKAVEALKERRRRAIDREKKDLEALAEKLSKASCTVAVKAGEDEKLFGSVTNADIAGVLKGEGLDVDKKCIILKQPITQLGIYQVEVKLHPEVAAEIRVWVVKE